MLATSQNLSTLKYPESDSHQPYHLIQKLKGHTDSLSSVAFAPQTPHLLASGSRDHTIRLWGKGENNQWNLVQTLTNHTNSVTTVCFSYNAYWLASGSWDNTVRVWKKGENNQWNLAQTFEGHTATIRSVAFSHDNYWLASGSGDSSIRLWKNTENNSWDLAQTLTEHGRSSIFSVAFSSENLLASGSYHIIQLWKKGTDNRWSALQTLTGHTDYITSLTFSHSEHWLASSSLDTTIRLASGNLAINTVCLWKKETNDNWRAIQTLQGHGLSVMSVAFLFDSVLASAGWDRDHAIRLWEKIGDTILVHPSEESVYLDKEAMAALRRSFLSAKGESKESQ